MKYKTPVSLVLAASALLMLGAVLPSVAADGQSTQVKKGHAVMEKLAKQSVASDSCPGAEGASAEAFLAAAVAPVSKCIDHGGFSG